MNEQLCGFTEYRRRVIDAAWEEWRRIDPEAAAMAEQWLLRQRPDYVDETERCIQRGED